MVGLVGWRGSQASPSQLVTGQSVSSGQLCTLDSPRYEFPAQSGGAAAREGKKAVRVHKLLFNVTIHQTRRSAQN